MEAAAILVEAAILEEAAMRLRLTLVVDAICWTTSKWFVLSSPRRRLSNQDSVCHRTTSWSCAVCVHAFASKEPPTLAAVVVAAAAAMLVAMLVVTLPAVLAAMLEAMLEAIPAVATRQGLPLLHDLAQQRRSQGLLLRSLTTKRARPSEAAAVNQLHVAGFARPSQGQ